MSPLTQTQDAAAVAGTAIRAARRQRDRDDRRARVLAATNQDLEALVAQGKFRQDLYYRLSVFTIDLPPLRERGDDLLLLVQHYLRRFNRELGKDVQTVAPEAMEVLRHYPWPGNVRELQSALKQALLRRPARC